jgi:hypothetical protein
MPTLEYFWLKLQQIAIILENNYFLQHIHNEFDRNEFDKKRNKNATVVLDCLSS